MTAKPAPKYHVGQKVFIIHPYGRQAVSEGEVMKVGRTLVHVRNTSFRATATDAYRMEDGSLNGDFGGRIRTLEEQDNHVRLTAAKTRLKELGLVFDGYGKKAHLTAELIEELVRTIEQHQQ